MDDSKKKKKESQEQKENFRISEHSLFDVKDEYSNQKMKCFQGLLNISFSLCIISFCRSLISAH